MSYNKSYPKGPFVGAFLFLFVIWTLWTLDIHHSINLVTDEKSRPAVGDQSPKVSSDRIPSPAPGKAPEKVLEVAPTATVTVEVVKPVPTFLSQPPATEDSLLTPATKDRPLILYAYSETDSARTNLKFFIHHGLHNGADFVFIINGESNDTSLIPQAENIQVVQRKNECYDLGAYSEILLKDDLYTKYKKFIMLNSSIRGPFMPYWAESCWSDRYLNKITDEVKLVGMTANCWPIFHIQSMIWATDIYGLRALLFPTAEIVSRVTSTPIPSAEHLFGQLHAGINSCFDGWNSAVSAEIGSSAVIKAAGYKLDVMMSAYHSTEKYQQECDNSKNGDVLTDHAYFGTNVHPYETIFLKSNRDIDPKNMEMMTEWVDGSEYSSYDYCSA